MRNRRDPKIEFDKIHIENIELNLKSRDDIPALLIGIQHLYRDKSFRLRLFELMDEYILPYIIDLKVDRPDVEMWRILVMGIIKQGLNCRFTYLHDMVNNHNAIRQFLGHTKAWDDGGYQYDYQTIVDNVSLLRPELFVAVNDLIVESGHPYHRRKAWRALARAK